MPVCGMRQRCGPTGRHTDNTSIRQGVRIRGAGEPSLRVCPRTAQACCCVHAALTRTAAASCRHTASLLPGATCAARVGGGCRQGLRVAHAGARSGLRPHVQGPQQRHCHCLPHALPGERQLLPELLLACQLVQVVVLQSAERCTARGSSRVCGWAVGARQKQLPARVTPAEHPALVCARARSSCWPCHRFQTSSLHSLPRWHVQRGSPACTGTPALDRRAACVVGWQQRTRGCVRGRRGAAVGA